MLRRFALFTVLLSAFAQSVGFPAEPTPAEKVAEISKDLEKISAGVGYLSKAAKAESIRNPTETTGAVSKALGRISSKLGPASKSLSMFVRDLKRAGAFEKLPKADRHKLEDEAEKISDAHEEFGKSGGNMLSEIDKARDRMNAMEIGLISWKNDSEYKIDADMVVKRPAEAVARLKKLADAIRANIAGLKKRDEALESLAETAGTVGKAMHLFADNLGEAYKYGGGMFQEMLALSSLEADEIARECSSLAADSKIVRKKVQQALEVEEHRLENLKTNVETLFQKQI